MENPITKSRRRRRQFLFALIAGNLLVCCFLAGCKRNSEGITAVPGGFPPGSSPGGVSSSDQVVKVTTSPVQIEKNRSANAVVRLSILSGYHVNANPATFPYLIATTVAPGKIEGVEVGNPSYPAAKKQKFQFEEEPLAVYEGETTVSLSLRAAANAQPGARSLPLAIRVQACDHEKCYPPANLDAGIQIEVK